LTGDWRGCASSSKLQQFGERTGRSEQYLCMQLLNHSPRD
jgi:hypothetical protein